MTPAPSGEKSLLALILIVGGVGYVVSSFSVWTSIYRLGATVRAFTRTTLPDPERCGVMRPYRRSRTAVRGNAVLAVRFIPLEVGKVIMWWSVRLWWRGGFPIIYNYECAVA